MEKSKHDSIFKELAAGLKGELHSDKLNTSIYATDASNYQIQPQAVALPKDEEDVRQIVGWAAKNRVPIVARGGGTSLVGQTVGEGLVVDFTKYMNQILELNVEEQWAWVQPGIVRDELNRKLLPDKLHFAPDPATTSRATVGGMIANNSSGTRSILYGKTLDHVLALEVLLADGSIIHCSDLTETELETKLEGQNIESGLYKIIFEIVNEHREEIETRFPKVMRRVGGYNLDEFLDNKWNLSRLITGSECTLGIILKAKIRLVPNPKFQSLCIVHFADFFDSISHIQRMVEFNPASVELLDHLLIEKSRENLETKRYCNFIQGEPGGVQVVEFFGETKEDAERKAQALAMQLKNQGIGYAWPVISDPKEMESVFTVRKKGLGLLMGVKGNRKPIAFIEDAAVPLEHLPHYIREVFDVCHREKVPVVAYAHASVGLLHVKPLLDLRDAEDIEHMKNISASCLQLVKKYKGSWSGEHGDGLARSPYNEAFFGSTLYNAFKEIKQLFDPLNIMNPGKITEAPPVDENLRYGKNYKDKNFRSMYHYRSEGSFSEAVHLCNGVGECRKLQGGTMCPSYRATLEEKDSTRGRANLLRMAMSGQLDDRGLESPLLEEIMDLCLSCKACKSECPSNVDMSKLKSEVLHATKKRKGKSSTDYLIQWQQHLGDLSTGYASGLVNVLMRSKPFRSILEKITGLDSRRILPQYSQKPFQNNLAEVENPDVVLFADTYVKYHEPSIGYAALKILSSLGLKVAVYSKGCCQRPALSKGLLEEARKKGNATLTDLEAYLKKQIPLVVCEPSCATALKDDLPDLSTDPRFIQYADHIFQLEDFLTSRQEWIDQIKIRPGDYLLHGHCHQKAMFTTKSVHQLFAKQTNVRLEELQTGCCGMAGSFGYEKKHYDLSKAIAESVLIPGIVTSNPDNHIIANGFSCRHQIQDLANRPAKHWAEYVDL
ncbi:MAG: FAD-binding protein [Saprospiraceae bacterium]|nr:FAD-binding protein [Saprospiraceae bacterium]